MVYQNFDSNKENQKLITDLLEYNIDQIYSGAQHYICVGQKRNISDSGSMVFHWEIITFLNVDLILKLIILIILK